MTSLMGEGPVEWKNSSAVWHAGSTCLLGRDGLKHWISVEELEMGGSGGRGDLQTGRRDVGERRGEAGVRLEMRAEKQ